MKFYSLILRIDVQGSGLTRRAVLQEKRNIHAMQGHSNISTDCAQAC